VLLPAVPVLFAMAVLIMGPAHGAAQAREVNLELQAWGLVVSYAFRIAPGHLLGLGVGAAEDQLAVTIASDTARSGLDQLQVHLFHRWRPNKTWDIDAGVRAGISDDGKPCDASDCDSFDSFYGPYVGVFVGGRRLKVGTRALLARRDRINRGRDWVGHIELLTGRLTLAW
jgi:hypothetical protein